MFCDISNLLSGFKPVQLYIDVLNPCHACPPTATVMFQIHYTIVINLLEFETTTYKPTYYLLFTKKMMELHYKRCKLKNLCALVMFIVRFNDRLIHHF